MNELNEGFTRTTTWRERIVSSIGHLYPLYSGCGTFANSRMMKTLSGDPSGLAWGKLRNGLQLRLFLDDFDGRAVYFTGDVDRKITWLCSRIVRSGDTVIDVGANIGLITFTLAKAVGPTGCVFSFEPNPQMVQLLEQSTSQNGLQNVRLFACALGHQDSDLPLYVPMGHAGRGSLVRHAPNRAYEEISVPVRTLSGVLQPVPQRIRLFKIDVEGFESQVLAGSSDVFERSRPDAVLFELNDTAESLRDHPTIVFLRDFDYEFFSIPKSYLSVRVVRCNPDKHTLVGHDLLACPKGDVSNQIAGLVRAFPRR